MLLNLITFLEIKNYEPPVILCILKLSAKYRGSFKPRVIGHVAPRVVKFGLQDFIRFIITSNSLLHFASVCFYTSDAFIYFQQAKPTLRTCAS